MGSSGSRLRSPLPLAAGLGLLALLPFGMASAQTPSKTETTAYTYTKDGSLLYVRTTVTEGHNQVAGDPTEIFFTWDNCTPQAGNPPTCALQPANGNLLGYGPSPGDESAWSAHYDALDRLSQVTNGQGHTAVYHYHPDELLKASLNAEAPRTDGLQHYYDQSHYPQVTNLYDRHTETLSSRHRRIRYLEDGRQQLLVRHRKDVDGVYDPIGQTMQPYRYDPYGAGGEGSAPRASMDRGGPLYSVNTNPFQYSDELRDPVSGADYLRARWYLPGHQMFVQRDPVRNLNRYGYAFGNPITNHDPSGGRPQRFGNFFKKLNPFEQGVLGALTLNIAPIIAGAELEGKKFWTGGGHAGAAVVTYSQLFVSVASIASFGGGVVASVWMGTRFSAYATEPVVFRGLVLGGGIPGFAQSGLQIARHPGTAFSAVENLLGGLVAGVGLEMFGGLAGRAVGDEIFERRVRAVSQEQVDSAWRELEDHVSHILAKGKNELNFARAAARFGRFGFGSTSDDGVVIVNNKLVSLEDHMPTNERTDDAIKFLRTKLAKTMGGKNHLSWVDQVSGAIRDYTNLSPDVAERVIREARVLQQAKARQIVDAIHRLEAERPHE